MVVDWDGFVIVNLFYSILFHFSFLSFSFKTPSSCFVHVLLGCAFVP